MTLLIHIPGEPIAQGRARATVVAGHARLYDPAKSRNWKAMARDYMQRAMTGDRPLEVLPDRPLDGPLQVHIIAVFTLPRSKWKKRAPVAMQWHTGRPDADNIGKIICDAGSEGILWLDDKQVADLRVQKVIGAQGQDPGLYVGIQPIPGINDETTSFMPLSGQVWSMLPDTGPPGQISGEMEDEP